MICILTCRVRTKYQFRLNRLREERLQRKLQNRQMEIISLRRAEEQKKKKEKAEKKQKQDERFVSNLYKRLHIGPTLVVYSHILKHLSYK